MMKNYLILFTLSPVQSFIAQARKTLDLHAGSLFLSQLTLSAIHVVKNGYGAEIIYPYVPDSNIPDSMPNRFLAQVQLPDDQAARALGEKLEAAVKATLLDLVEKSLEEMRIDETPLHNESEIDETPTSENFPKRFSDQLLSYFEIYWVFEQLEPTAESFRAAYVEVDKNMSIIKRMRPFEQLPRMEKRRKCSVTGERNALVFNRKGKQLPAYVDVNEVQRIKMHPSKLSEGEGLSTIAAVKRFGVTKKRFMSTAGIGALAFEQAASNSQLKFQLANYKHSFESDDWDAQLYFPENLTQRYLDQHLTEHPSLKPLQLQTLLGDLRKKAKAENLPTINSYYALLSFDGDNMGKIWSGSSQYLGQTADLKSFQLRLAKLLFDFAQNAKAYLNEKRGEAVYAGGDDFIGFVNLYNLFDVLIHLRNLFRLEVHNKLKAEFKENLLQEISFSAGICIAHYKNPLGEVVRQAKKAQDDAKNKGGRNAFAFYVMKRSGAVQTATLAWGDETDLFKHLVALRRCTELLQYGCFSNTFIHVLEREFLTLLGRSSAISSDVSYMLELEIKRLVVRARIDQGINAYQQQFPSTSTDDLLSDMQDAVLILFKRSGGSNDIRNFLQMLDIADFLNRQPDHAN